MFTVEDVLTTCERHPERADWVSLAVRRYAAETAQKATALLVLFGASRKLTSGFRDLDSNRRAGGAPYSRHLYGQAVDIEDPDRKLSQFITPEILEQCELWMEYPHYTSSWVHVQIVPPLSKERVFVP